MTIQTSFTNWSSSGLNWRRPPYESCSPNLVALNKYLMSIGGQHLGCHGNREVRGGGSVSAHAYGAALDWRYDQTTNGGKNLGRQWALADLFPWLIDYSAELGIDAIHDYVGDRIWRAGRTPRVEDAHGSWWRKQNGAGSGMGEAWATYVHIESTKDSFADDTPIGERGIPLLGEGPPRPDPKPDPPAPPTPRPPVNIKPTNLEFTDMFLLTKTKDGPWVAATGFGAGSLSVGPSKDHDISLDDVFAAGDGKVLNVGIRPMKVQTRTQFDGTGAVLTDAQARALLGHRI